VAKARRDAARLRLDAACVCERDAVCFRYGAVCVCVCVCDGGAICFRYASRAQAVLDEARVFAEELVQDEHPPRLLRSRRACGGVTARRAHAYGQHQRRDGKPGYWDNDEQHLSGARFSKVSTGNAAVHSGAAAVCGIDIAVP
jgi:hypothetical protein